MTPFSDLEAKMLHSSLQAEFPGYHIDFVGDPEDDRMFLVRIYDVAESDVRDFRNRMYPILDAFEKTLPSHSCFCPSCVNPDDTLLYYPEFCRNPLKPIVCSWCGDVPRISKDQNKKWVLECVNQKCAFPTQTAPQDSLRDAIQAWNDFHSPKKENCCRGKGEKTNV